MDTRWGKSRQLTAVYRGLTLRNLKQCYSPSLLRCQRTTYGYTGYANQHRCSLTRITQYSNRINIECDQLDSRPTVYESFSRLRQLLS